MRAGRTVRDRDSCGWGNSHREESTESWTHKVKSGGGTVRGHESCRRGNLHREKSREWKTEKVMSGIERHNVIDLLC